MPSISSTSKAYFVSGVSTLQLIAIIGLALLIGSKALHNRHDTTTTTTTTTIQIQQQQQ